MDSAVLGWKQSIDIMRKLKDGLQFTINEINENKGAFAPNKEKAENFDKARQALRLADYYLNAMDVAFKS